MRKEVILATLGLRAGYGGKPVLQGLEMEVREGEIVAVIGRNGVGKSTLMKSLIGLVPAMSGSIIYRGEAVELLPAYKRARLGIGYVPQGRDVFPRLTVGENIAVGPRLAGWSRERIAGRIGELLDLVALPRGFATRRPAELSGGQQQRVGLARALAAEPRIMLMDEPFGALDPVTRLELGDAYRELHGRLGLTTVMVTHDVQEAVLLADRIVVMKDGRILADDSPKALLAGHPDPDVSALMATPRVQAERVTALIAGSRGG